MSSGWSGALRPLLSAETTAVRTITIADPHGEEEAFFGTAGTQTLVLFEPDGHGNLTTGPVPDNGSAPLIAYRVAKGKIGIRIQRPWMSGPAPPRPLTFEPSNIVELILLLRPKDWLTVIR